MIDDVNWSVSLAVWMVCVLTVYWIMGCACRVGVLLEFCSEISIVNVWLAEIERSISFCYWCTKKNCAVRSWKVHRLGNR